MNIFDWLTRELGEEGYRTARRTFREGHVHGYLRISHRYLTPDLQLRCIDIADINVDEAHQRQGLFTLFLTQVEQAADYFGAGVFVESIHTDHLFESLLKRGYIRREYSYPMDRNVYRQPLEL